MSRNYVAALAALIPLCCTTPPAQPIGYSQPNLGGQPDPGALSGHHLYLGDLLSVQGKFRPLLDGWGAFRNIHKRHSGVVQLVGKNRFDLSAGETAGVDAIEIFAAPGDIELEELAMLPPVEKFKPSLTSWRRFGIPAPWNGGNSADGDGEYTLLVRYHLWYDLNGETTRFYFDRPGTFQNITRSDVVLGSFAPPTYDPPQADTDDGSSASTAFATGTFIGTQGLSLYDVEVEYNKRVASIEIWVAPTGTTLPSENYVVEVYGDDSNEPMLVPPPPSGSYGQWSCTGIDAPYAMATASYTMLIKVTFYQPTGSSESHTGTFSSIVQGTSVPLHQ